MVRWLRKELSRTFVIIGTHRFPVRDYGLRRLMDGVEVRDGG